MINRRGFLKTAAALAGAGAGSALNSVARAAEVKYPGYENNVQDRLWMWGHGAGSTKGRYALPAGGDIQPAEAISYMGIPNVCMIRWQNIPEPPFDEYVKQFANTKRLAWSVLDNARQPYAEKKRMAFELARKMPNLTSLYLDDFFHHGAVPKPGRDEAPAALPVAAVRALMKEVAAQERRLDVSVVLYDYQLNPAIVRHIELCDVVSFWTWKASDLVNLQRNFETYRKLVPDKRTLLGVYMWNFGNSKPIPIELMEHQCSLGLRWLQDGKIEGMIFHCTPLCDMKLEAVEWARRWIARHAKDVVGT